MITFDAEDDSKGTCFLMGFYNGKHYTSFELKDYKTERSYRKAIIDYILNSEEITFIAHNLEYDLSHIFQGEFLTVIDWYYSSSLIFAKLPGTKIKFIDSFHFSYTSLKEIGKEIKFGKKSIDIDNIYEVYKKNPAQVIKYNKYDCMIVHKYMEQFAETIKTEFNLNIKNTLSGTSQAIYLKHFCDYDVAGHNNNDELLKAYYGGRVECFHIGEINRPVFEIDVNSMYPYVMKNFKYPTGDYYVSKEPVEKLHIAKIRVSVKKNIDLPVLPYRAGKLLFCTGDFETYASSMEIATAIKEKQIKDIEYLSVYNFGESDYIFRSFIDFFYSRRQRAKDFKNKFDSEYYKRLMNHLYGRFALHKNLKKLTRITRKNVYRIEPVTDSAGYETLEMSGKSKNYSLSLFVTAYARIYLYELLKKVSKYFDILYCDTDSCYFTKFEYMPLMDMIDLVYQHFKIDNRLGNYSLNAYESGIFYNVKAYLLNHYYDNIQLKVKDFTPKKQKEFLSIGKKLNDIVNSKKIKLKGIKKEHREEFFKKGTVSYSKPMRMRSALRGVQGIPVNSWELYSITRKGSYEKREMIKLNKNLYTTKPLIMGEFKL